VFGLGGFQFGERIALLGEEFAAAGAELGELLRWPGGGGWE
jgi:hypothetical protein